MQITSEDNQSPPLWLGILTFRRKRQTIFFVTLSFLLFLSASPDGCYAETAVIPVQHRWASEILPIVNHFLSSTGVATVDERTNSLIIVDTADSIKNIKNFLLNFDQPVKRVRIRLKFTMDQSSQEQDLSVTGGISEKKWGVTVGEKNKRGIDVRIGNSKEDSRQGDEYVVHTTSGSTAFILTGKEITYREGWGRYCQGNAACSDAITFQKVDTGMEVKALIVGGHANVEITPRLSHFENNARGGIVRFSAAATQLQVSLGQWVAIGGVDKKSSEVFREIIGGGRGKQKSSFSMMLMVETY